MCVLVIKNKSGSVLERTPRVAFAIRGIFRKSWHGRLRRMHDVRIYTIMHVCTYKCTFVDSQKCASLCTVLGWACPQPSTQFTVRDTNLLCFGACALEERERASSSSSSGSRPPRLFTFLSRSDVFLSTASPNFLTRHAGSRRQYNDPPF